MEFISSWIQGIIIAVIIATIIEMIIPNGNNKKYIKIVLGIFILFNIITPVISKISKNDFSISSIINIDEYEKKMQTYETDYKNTDIDTTNSDSIKQIYISKLKSDIKSKIEEKEYLVNDIFVQIEDDNEYTINKIEIYVDKKKNNTNSVSENKNTNINILTVNEIKIENINISSNSINEEKVENQKNNLSNKEKNELIQYISSTYNVQEKNIYIN